MGRRRSTTTGRLAESLSVVFAVALVFAGCSTSGSEGGQDGEAGLTVFAAASLKNSFTALADEFSETHGGVDVSLNFDGSQALVTQIEQGADADVVATADEKSMAKLGEKVVDPQIFATNVLTIVTAPGNPKNIRTLADVTKDGVTTVICSESVPCGSAAALVEENTGIDIKPVSEETAVTGVLSKVQTGQADAGLVYVTDAVGAGDSVTTVADPALAAVVNAYPIGAVAESENAPLAQQFVDMVTGAQGAAVLERMGFGPAT